MKSEIYPSSFFSLQQRPTTSATQHHKPNPHHHYYKTHHQKQKPQIATQQPPQSETITLHVPKPILMNHDPMLATHRSISKPPLATNQSCRCHHTDKVVTNTKQIDQRAEREGRG